VSQAIGLGRGAPAAGEGKPAATVSELDARGTPSPQQVKKRVLVVDDIPVERELLRLILEDGGYEVDEAQHGSDAITQMGDPLPDLVMTDLMMPVMTGQQLVQHLRSDRRTALVPILVLSANPNAAKIAAQADAVVGKPFERANLLATVNALVRRATSE
jgi:CheY-like chemotaxis protein